MIRFACPCGRQLQAKDEDAGKKAKCPNCGAVVVVAAEDPVEPPEPPRDDPDESPREQRVRQESRRRDSRGDERDDRRRGRDRDDTEYDDEPEERGKRRRRKRGVAEPEQTSGKAIWALVCGIASLCLIITSVPGLILGAMALRDIDRSEGELGGKGAAITGIVLSCLSFVILAPVLLLAGLLFPAVSKVRNAAERVQDANNLKQMSLAMLNFEATYRRYPQAAAFTDANGKPLLSWRVALLPYVEQDQLFRQFRLNEPWDSPHNKALIPLMPKVYALPGDRNPPGSGLTYYQVFVGPRTLFEPKKGPSEPGRPELGWGLVDIIDGTSNTVLIATAANPVVWTRPDDLAFTPDGPLPPLGGHMSAGYNIATADGAVHLLQPGTPEATLRALITRNGNEPVSIPQR